MFIKAYFKGTHQMVSLKPITNIQTFHSLIRILFPNLTEPYTVMAEIRDNKFQITNNEGIDRLRASEEKVIKIDIKKVGFTENDETQLMSEVGNNDVSAHEGNEDVLPCLNINGKHDDDDYLWFTCKICDAVSGGDVMYRCSVCNDFAICSDCQDTYEHDHPFLKIKNAKYRDHKVFVILDPQGEGSEKPEQLLVKYAKQSRKNGKEKFLKKISHFTNSYIGSLLPGKKKIQPSKTEELSVSIIAERGSSNKSEAFNINGCEAEKQTLSAEPNKNRKQA